ncbi:hypothetical protein H0X10_01605 [Candidatus Saccharibacteria bacterium]|nr:hypothetical protein [Candidatus Saccharibacteria bacterium]
MARINISSKHLQINKASTMITTTLAIASFVTAASLVGAKTMFEQRSYQSKVITEKELAVKTLKENIDAVNTLVTSYKEFIGRPVNIIDGSTTGTGDRDGDNAKIILDALPSKYDFPAITTSLEKVLSQDNFIIKDITGVDDEIAQNAKETETPEVVEIPFSFSIGGEYGALNDLIKKLETSIRPFQILKIEFNVSDSAELNIDAKTFYQSEKKLNITTKVVK